MAAGFRPRLIAAVTVAMLGRLKDRERSGVLDRMALPKAELRTVEELEEESQKIAKVLSGPKTASVPDAYAFLEKTPLDFLGYILAESSNAKAVSQIRNYLNKWKPLRQALPAVAMELEAIGLERGPKFDKVLDDFFLAQLAGRARKPEDHAKVLRKLAGIKEPPKKVEEKKKPEKGKKKANSDATPGTPVEADVPKSKVGAPAHPGPATKEGPQKKVPSSRVPARSSPKPGQKKASGKKK
jgi:hypothetical protein